MPETQEGNNTAARAVTVGGDLIVSALTVPSTAGAGSILVVSDTTANQGGGAVVSTTTRFYLSSNTALDASDVLLDGARTVPGLAAGTSSSGSTSVTLPSNITTGTYYIIAKADSDNAVVETRETNNTTARSTQVGSDLIVSSVTAPATGGSGAAIVVSDTTKNQGAGAAAASTTRFYLSTNSILDNSDTLLPGGRPVPSLVSGASSSGFTTLVLPPGLAVATYY